uniref:serine/threonine-protein kinase/endoribonuclease IRE1-like n=1 Tax=Styela clava TaxID=7725 RepID=UPI0019393D8A|nr:serine/threonine-protein kinase/endoribonuclease IRE1-like [Styela clava]
MSSVCGMNTIRYKGKKKYAVKLRTIDSSIFEDKFLNETEMENQLDDHVNIVRYKKHHIDSTVQERTLVFVTQLCNNEKLENLLPTFSFKQKKILLIQLCHGLKYIHDNQIAHRNLTPGNVLLSLDGKNIKIMDFGISKKFALDEKKIITRSTGFNGTLGWVASEMCSDNRSKGFEAWVKADIYSLGLLIYYIFTDGKHPYEGDANDKHQGIKNKKPPDFSFIENSEKFHDRYLLIDILKAMLSHEPDARPGITQILQHCITWDAVKKMSFIKDCHLYLEQPRDEDRQKPKRKAKRQLEHNGTVKQRMAYIGKESIDNYSSDDSEEFVQFGRSGGAPKDNDGPELTEEEEKALERIHEITGGDWVELIKKMLEDPNSGNNKRPYENSFTDLVRYIRNTHEYFKDNTRKMKSKLGSRNEGMWNFIASNVPKFFIYLFNLMKNELEEDDKKRYLQEKAKNCELPQE